MKEGLKKFFAIIIGSIVFFVCIYFIGKWLTKYEKDNIKSKAVKTICCVSKSFRGDAHRRKGSSRKVMYTYCENGKFKIGTVSDNHPIAAGEYYSLYYNPNDAEEAYINWHEAYILSDSIMESEAVITEIKDGYTFDNEKFVTFMFRLNGQFISNAMYYPDSLNLKVGDTKPIIYAKDKPNRGILLINQNDYLQKSKWCEATDAED